MALDDLQINGYQGKNGSWFCGRIMKVLFGSVGIGGFCPEIPLNPLQPPPIRLDCWLTERARRNFGERRVGCSFCFLFAVMEEHGSAMLLPFQCKENVLHLAVLLH